MTYMKYREHLEKIFRAGLDRVNPYEMIMKHVRISGDMLSLDIDGYKSSVNLAEYSKIVLIGAGKASGRMALAFETLLGDRISGGLVCVKYGHTEKLKFVEITESAHPVPDENGVRAAKRIAEIADEADENTLVINCISGGGSALLPYPMDSAASGGKVNLTLKDKQETTAALLRCGADIKEINCIRKHISGLKGGRLLQKLYPARSLNFILSDVIGDDLGSIASGMTSFDVSTFNDALAVVKKYGIRDELPEQVVMALEYGASGEIAETVKKGDNVLENSENILIGTNSQALAASASAAKALGYNVVSLTSQLSGDAGSAAKVLSDIAKDVCVNETLVSRPACIIAGGETVVTVKGDGKGGRCQEKALVFLKEMSGWGDTADNVYFLSASTDGNDGPTDAAGGFADKRSLKDAKEKELSIDEYLSNNDSYHFHDKNGTLLKTGPTNTNVCDLQIIIIA